MTASLFAYGTLAVTEVMRAVTGRPFEELPARLNGYACYRLHGLPYPGLRPWAGAITYGVLYLGLDQDDWAACDAFEDDGCYRRESLSVDATDGRRHEAQVYLIKPECYGLLSGEAWSAENFRQNQLSAFLARYGLG